MIYLYYISSISLDANHVEQPDMAAHHPNAGV